MHELRVNIFFSLIYLNVLELDVFGVASSFQIKIAKFFGSRLKSSECFMWKINADFLTFF